MKKVNLIIIVALAIFLLLSFFSIPKSSLFSPSLKNLKPFEMGVLYKYCISDSQCDLNQKCFKNSCRNKICTDTDGGIVPEVFGTVSVSLEGIPSSPFGDSDECVNSLNLKEFFCNENSDSANQIILCPGVCLNGACVESVCGDGILSSDEQCDGEELGNEDCISQGFDSGVLLCNPNCQFDFSGCANSQDCTNNIPPTAILPDDISNWPVGKPLTIYSESTDSDGEIVSYFWNFGDEKSEMTDVPFVNHTYNNTGFFTVSLTVTDNCDATSTDTMQVYSNLTADFWYFPHTVMEDESVYFEAYAPKHLVFMPDSIGYNWCFSDAGCGFFKKNLSRPFHYQGSFTATLRIRNLSGSYIYSEPQTIEVVSEPTDPPFHRLGLVPGSHGNGLDIGIVENIAWLASGNGGIFQLSTINISNSTAPELIANKTFSGAVGQIAASSNIVAVAGSTDGLYLFNAANPQNPTILYNYDTWDLDGTRAFGVAKSGNYVYLASETNLKVLDVTVPTAPVLVNTQNVLSNSRIALDNNRLYVGSWPGGQTGSILVYDLTNPTTPQFIGQLTTSKKPYDIAIKENLLFATERNTADVFEPARIVVFNLSNGIPTEPLIRIGSVEPGSSTTYRTIALGTSPLGKSKLYATSSEVLVVIDITNISQPSTPWAIPIGDTPHGIRATADQKVLLGLTTDTLSIYGYG